MGGQSLLWENSRCSGRTVTAVGGGSLLRWTTVILCYGAMGGWSLLWELVTAIGGLLMLYGRRVTALGRRSLLWEEVHSYGRTIASMA